MTPLNKLILSPIPPFHYNCLLWPALFKICNESFAPVSAARTRSKTVCFHGLTVPLWHWKLHLMPLMFPYSQYHNHAHHGNSVLGCLEVLKKNFCCARMPRVYIIFQILYCGWVWYFVFWHRCRVVHHKLVILFIMFFLISMESKQRLTFWNIGSEN